MQASSKEQTGPMQACSKEQSSTAQKNITYLVLADKLSHNLYGHLKREGHLHQPHSNKTTCEHVNAQLIPRSKLFSPYKEPEAASSHLQRVERKSEKWVRGKRGCRRLREAPHADLRHCRICQRAS